MSKVPVAGIIALFAAAASPAAAIVVTAPLDIDLTKGPYTLDLFLGGASTLTFSIVDPWPFALDPIGVQTDGVEILSIGQPFYDPPRPASFFSNRGGSIGPDSLGQYLSYDAPAAIPTSITDTVIGFRFSFIPGEFNYGFVQLGGTVLNGFRFELTPDRAIGIAGIPEPASWALMLVGFGLVGAGVRRRRTPAPA